VEPFFFQLAFKLRLVFRNKSSFHFFTVLFVDNRNARAVCAQELIEHNDDEKDDDDEDEKNNNKKCLEYEDWHETRIGMLARASPKLGED